MGKKLGAALLSILVNIGLLASKIVVAFLTNSLGLYAEAAHSLFDLISSALAYLGIKKAEEPSDETHHFGHDKFENLSSLLQTILLAGTAGIVFFEAYEKLQNPGVIESSELGIVLMLVSIPVAYLTSRYLHEIAHKEGSAALEADSAHFTTDVLGAGAVLIGLLLVRFGFPIGDALAAFAVGGVMLQIALKLGIKSFVVFMDFSPDKETMRAIERAIDSQTITRFHKLRARFAGSKIIVDVHIQLPKKTSLVNAHAIAHDVEDAIKHAVPEVKEVTVHMEPD